MRFRVNLAGYKVLVLNLKFQIKFSIPNQTGPHPQTLPSVSYKSRITTHRIPTPRLRMNPLTATRSLSPIHPQSSFPPE
jgi:hypothetical protein